MGTVYKARHAMLRRATAVKMLDVDKMSETAIARFEREVQLTSGLTHPNTVAIFDYGRTPEGIFYYAMEYLEGMNLQTFVHRTGPQGEARAVYILRQICGALGEAHASGLVHRDIKPANIFLTSRGGLHDFVKVLDFGLVKSNDSEDNAGITNPNGVTGTPLYISPEAVYHPDQVDARSDVHRWPRNTVVALALRSARRRSTANRSGFDGACTSTRRPSRLRPGWASPFPANWKA